MKRTLPITIVTILLIGCSTIPPANPITSISVKLPDTNKWFEITNSSKGNQYIHEYVPAGSTADHTKWIIVEQKLILDTPMSAERYIDTIFTLAKGECTDILYNGPEEAKISNHDSYVGRFMCAEQKGKSYGSFTDQRVITQGNTAYVVTSELRVPISPKANVLIFSKDQLGELTAFMKRQSVSASFVRNAVNICISGQTKC